MDLGLGEGSFLGLVSVVDGAAGAAGAAWAAGTGPVTLRKERTVQEITSIPM